MTIEESMRERLNQYGIFDAQKDGIMEAVKSDIDNSMNDRWDDDTQGYSEALLDVVWYGTVQAAIKWGNENLPKAIWLMIMKDVVRNASVDKQ